MIHLARLRAETTQTVEARARLYLAQDIGIGLERAAFGAEEEFVEVLRFAEHRPVRFEAANEAQPFAADLCAGNPAVISGSDLDLKSRRRQEEAREPR